MIDSQNALNIYNKLSNIKNNDELKIIKKELKKYQNELVSTSLYFQFFDNQLSQNINLKKKYYLEIASDIAKNSNMFQKHGAIIVYKKNIIGKGCNNTTIKKNSNCNYSIHAEISAINNVIKNYNKDILQYSDLFVVRISNDNLLKYSKPCINCQKYINKFNIKKTYYSTNYEYDKFTLNL
ncbi:MAG: hypothetical protein CMM02_20785 [Rhodopirellula sp.]|nr:hypothetical protein [Rhodopirellula sp.]|tara:strand:- start:1797 stop:2339 length:543 start_codon:yes stop_codon:yes gene_type:complete